MSNILFIGAHVDDVNLSCGGTITKLNNSLNDITIVSLSRIYNGIDLRDEFDSANCAAHDCLLYDFKTRDFDKIRQNILELLLDFKGYDYVFTHSPFDMHQDHAVVGQESIRAFKHTNLITYCADWNTRNFTRNYFIKLQTKHIENKVVMLACYKSQIHRNYMQTDYTWANAINTGVICAAKYAESFQAINLIQ